jgi:iron complex transport system substrate-binding protein
MRQAGADPSKDLTRASTHLVVGARALAAYGPLAKRLRKAHDLRIDILGETGLFQRLSGAAPDPATLPLAQAGKVSDEVCLLLNAFDLITRVGDKVAFADANNHLLDLLLPGWQAIPTGFLTGFQSNTEELLKLEPDIILVYGQFQREGLQGLPVPILDFHIDNQDNEAWSVAIETLMREIFTAGGGALALQKEWDQAKKQAVDLLANRKGPKKKGLMIMSNTGDKVTVRGIGSYGDDWLKKSGLVNAADIKGDNREVSMEQLYAWNPDIIYVFRGIPAARYLGDGIAGQRWHPITAVRKGAVHDMPLGLMNWGAPHADSPLTLLWLIGKNYQGLISDAEFRGKMKAYYSRRYHITLSDRAIETILNPHAK